MARRLASDHGVQASCRFRGGTHTATHLLGFPPLTKATADVAEFSNMLLTSAALCEGVLDLADEHRRR